MWRNYLSAIWGHLKKGKFMYAKPRSEQRRAVGRAVLKPLLGLCLKRMDGCFENGIAASDDVRARRMGWDIRLDTNTDKLATAGKTVVFGTDASAAAAG
jgi:hypothetical protein